MSVAKIIEIICCSSKSFDDAINNGVSEAAKTINDIRGAWVKDMSLCIEDGRIIKYKVILKLTFEVNREDDK